LFRAVEVCESRVLLSATTTTASSAGTNAVAQLEPDNSAMLPTYTTAAYTTTGSLAEQSGTAFIASLPDAGFGLNDFSGSAATDGTELGQVVGPYNAQIDGAAAGFTETTMSTWQGTQQQTSDQQFTTVASPGAGDSPSTSGDSDATDPWISAFLGDDQNTSSSSTEETSDTTEPQPPDGDDTDSENAGGDSNLPEPTVSSEFTTTTTVNHNDCQRQCDNHDVHAHQFDLAGIRQHGRR